MSLGVPHSDYWTEMLNIDAESYGDSNLGKGGGVDAEDVPSQYQPASVAITLPPLATVILKAP